MNLAELESVARQEIKQKEEEGCDVTDCAARIETICEKPEKERREALDALLDDLSQMTGPHEEQEPSDLDAIRALRPDALVC